MQYICMLKKIKTSLTSSSAARKGIVLSIIAILIITVLEFPPPLGFETRPQSGVSMYWLVFFLTIVVVEIAAIPLVFKKPGLGKMFAIAAAILNILQVIADQAHLLQPEVAPLGYSMLEGTVVLFSLTIIYFSLKLR